MALALLVAFTSCGINSADAHHQDDITRGSNDPQISVGGSTAYIVWNESIGQDSNDVYFTKVTDGKPVGDPTNITNGIGYYPTTFIHTNQNNVYLLWEDRQSSNGDDEMYFAKSNDFGEKFSKSIKLDPVDNGRTVYRPSSILQVNDILYVFGQYWNRDTQQSNFIFIKSDDFGKTFSESVLLFNHEQSDQDMITELHDDVIYILSDDRKNYDEDGSLYLRKILSDGTLTDLVNVNEGKTSVTHPQFAVSGDNVYVSWRERVFEKTNDGIHERWYQVFAKSHDGGNEFGDVMRFDSDPNSIDTVGADGDFVLAIGDSVYVFWESQYWDGETQESQIFLAYSQNNGKDFEVAPAKMDEKISEHGIILSHTQGNELRQIAITEKNPPYNDAAVYYAGIKNHVMQQPIDILEGIQTQVGWIPKLVSDDDYIHFVAEAGTNDNCILYSFSENGGKSFDNAINLSPNGDDHECLGIPPYTQSPLKQVSDGVEYHDVKCREDRSAGYILSLRERDGLPVCVSAASYDDLVKRGWLAEDGQEMLSLSAARQFVLTAPTFTSGGNEESLELQITNVRKTIPPIVTVDGSFVFSNASEIPRSGSFSSVLETHEDRTITMQATNINKIHSAIIDGVWDEIGQDFVENIPNQGTFHDYSPGPTSRMILTIGDAINKRGMIPITITEISENVKGMATFWQFQPIRHDGDNRGKTWDFLPDSYRQGWGFFDEDGNDAWDDSKIPRDKYGIPADGHGYPLICGNERINGESAHPSGIPIKPEIETVIVKSGQMGYLPDSDGIYTIRFVSLFETDVEFPDSAKIIENETMLCAMENIREDATHAYYTKLIFELGD